MKKLTFFLLFALCTLTAQAQREPEFDECFVTCYYGNETFTAELFGDFYVETKYGEHSDFQVQIVDSPEKATYIVYKTTDKPQKCGEWRFVKDKSKAKFVIRIEKNDEPWVDAYIYFTNNRSETSY